MRWTAACALALLAACTSHTAHPTRSDTSASPASSASSASTSAAVVAPADWTTYHGDVLRSGASTTMPSVHGLRVTARLALDGAVYASPVIVGGRSFVATENDTVYAFDAHYAQVWRTHIGTPSPASDRPCGNIDPLGITGTPVVADGVVYVAAEYTAPVRHELVALDAATGSVRWRTNIDLPGASALVMQQRAALTIADGRVWVAFGGLAGDCGDYKGRVVGVSTDGTGVIAYTVPTHREAGIWAPPGPSVDEHGRLVVSVGNGAAGSGDAYDFSDSILALGADAQLRDSFSPAQWAQDNESDRDLGSQGPAFVGPFVFIAGKAGTGYVLRRDRLGGIGGEVSSASVCVSFGGTAVVSDVVYVPCVDGVRAVRVDATGHLTVLWHATDAVSGSPVVGGGRVWALDMRDGVLHALDPATGRSREQVQVGVTSRFATPALYGTSVFVPTLSGMTVVTTRS